MVYITHYSSPSGQITLADRGGALCGLWFDGQKYFLGSVSEETQERTTPLLLQTESWLDRYFAGERPQISELPLAPAGSEFQKAVWQILCGIPYGETATYGEIAKILAGDTGARDMSAQAVGSAVGHNPISVIIPCHRVVGKSGSLTGYAGGMERKLWLLKHEGADTDRLFIPKNSTAP